MDENAVARAVRESNDDSFYDTLETFSTCNYFSYPPPAHVCLKIALSAQTEDRLHALSAYGIDVLAADAAGSGPLHFCAPGMVPAFVAFGADVNAPNNIGMTPLHSAGALTSAAAKARALVASGADTEATGGPFMYTPFLKAVRDNHGHLARALFCAGANPHAVDNIGGNALDTLVLSTLELVTHRRVMFGCALPTVDHDLLNLLLEEGLRPAVMSARLYAAACAPMSTPRSTALTLSSGILPLKSFIEVAQPPETLALLLMISNAGGWGAYTGELRQQFALYHALYNRRQRDASPDPVLAGVLGLPLAVSMLIFEYSTDAVEVAVDSAEMLEAPAPDVFLPTPQRVRDGEPG